MTEEFLDRMVELANDVGEELSALPDARARYDMVKEIVDGAQVVFAVWQDQTAEGGVGFMLIKGQALARQILADKEGGIRMRTTAIPCMEAEQAEALLHELGERHTCH